MRLSGETSPFHQSQQSQDCEAFKSSPIDRQSTNQGAPSQDQSLDASNQEVAASGHRCAPRSGTQTGRRDSPHPLSVTLSLCTPLPKHPVRRHCVSERTDRSPERGSSTCIDGTIIHLYSEYVIYI